MSKKVDRYFWCTLLLWMILKLLFVKMSIYYNAKTEWIRVWLPPPFIDKIPKRLIIIILLHSLIGSPDLSIKRRIYQRKQSKNPVGPIPSKPSGHQVKYLFKSSTRLRHKNIGCQIPYIKCQMSQPIQVNTFIPDPIISVFPQPLIYYILHTHYIYTILYIMSYIIN